MSTPYAQEAFLHQLLGKALSASASDVHLKVGQPPGARVRGDLVFFRVERIKPEDTEAAARLLLGLAEDEALPDAPETVFAYDAAGLGRFRVSFFRQRGALSIVMRSIPLKIPTFAELGVPPAVTALVEQPRGLVVVAGAAGQGRSTTLAAMIGHLNQSYPKHVITIEDPIEHLHEDHRASVCQREVGSDVAGFADGLRGMRTLDPDVIAVSDLRDASAVEAAVEAAEMGRLVLAVLGAPDVGRAVGRLLAGVSPARIAAVLEGVIAQRLLPKRDGSGVALAAELLVASGAVREALRAGGDPAGALRDLMEKGATPYGMQTFEVAVKQLVAQGLVSKASLSG